MKKETIERDGKTFEVTHIDEFTTKEVEVEKIEEKKPSVVAKVKKAITKKAAKK